MTAEVLQALTDTTLASSAAVLLVRLLRKPMRAAAGARAAYWLWLLVPAMAAAALLPAPPGERSGVACQRPLLARLQPYVLLVPWWIRLPIQENCRALFTEIADCWVMSECEHSGKPVV